MEILEERIEEMVSAIKNKDFEKVVMLTMVDSNQFHAICLDSFPPLFYLNDSSIRIIESVHEFNNPRIKVAYTFDAGANAFLITKDEFVDEVTKYFKSRFDFEIIDAL